MSDVITRLLIQSRPQSSTFDAAFTNKVMSSITPVEIFAPRVRKMNVKRKDIFIMKLRTLPIAAVVALALGAALLLGGTSYAVYKLLWEQPTVQTQSPTKNQYGRTQVIASLEKCGDQKSAATFEIKSGSTLDPAEIQKILQARCELDVINVGSGAFDPTKPMMDGMKTDANGRQTITTKMLSPVASKIVSIDKNSMSLTGDKYNTPKVPQKLNANTRYIVNNHIAKVTDFKPGDSVVFVKEAVYAMTTDPEDSSRSTGGAPISEIVTDVIRVELPFEYYGPGKQNQIAQRMPCESNPQDSCVQGGSINLYENLAAASLQADSTGNNFTNSVHSIQGGITELKGNIIKLKSSSGRIFTLTLPRDVVSEYNQNRSSGYNNTKVEVGDMVAVEYIADNGDMRTEINERQIFSVSLMLSLIQKDDPIKKY